MVTTVVSLLHLWTGVEWVMLLCLAGDGFGGELLNKGLCLKPPTVLLPGGSLFATAETLKGELCRPSNGGLGEWEGDHMLCGYPWC